MNLREEYAKLHFEDASMYFNNCLVIRKSDGKVCRVALDDFTEGHEDGETEYPYQYLVCPVNSTVSNIFDPPDFFNYFELMKCELGWHNVKSTACYITGSNGRTVKKSLVIDSVRSYNPYQEALEAILSNSALEVTRNDVDGAPDFSNIEGLGSVQEIREKLIGYCSNKHVLSYINGGMLNPDYYSIDDVISNFTGDRPEISSMAMSKEFAASLTKQHYNKEASLFYHTSIVGKINANGVGVYVGYEDVIPQLDRKLGIEVEIIS